MVRVEEREVYRALVEHTGEGNPFKIAKAEIQISMRAQDTHIGDSPDFILWLVVSLKIFAQNLKIEIPLPVEAEGRGINYALEDLQKFIERERYPVELPMLVVASKGYANMERTAKLPVKFNIKQIPARLLKH